MLNKPFPELLKEFSVDYKKEYKKLVRLFYHEESFIPKLYSRIENTTLHACCEAFFINYPYRRTILTLKEFDETFKLNFPFNECKELNDLIYFCEYVFNLLYYIKIYDEAGGLKSIVMDYIERLCKELRCKINKDEDGVFFIVKEDPLLESLCSVVKEPIGIKMLKYTHHSMKGNLEEKSRIISDMAKELEGVRNDSKYHYSRLFFEYANTCHIRHYNLGGNKKKVFVSELDNSELEDLYDKVFKLGVIAFAEYENQESIRYLRDNKDEINRK